MIRTLRQIIDNGYGMDKNEILNELKEIEEELESEKERVAMTLQSIGDGIITTDLIGNITFINKTAEQLTGWAIDEVIGRRLYDVFHIKIRGTSEVMNHLFETAIEERTAIGLRDRSVLVAKDQQERFVSASIAPIIDRKDNVIGVVVAFRDITRIKKSEEMLRSLSQAVEQSANSVIIMDTEGKIQYVNSKFIQTTGYTMKEVIGKNLNIFQSGEQGDKVYAELWRRITSGDQWSGELLSKKKNGEVYWELTSVSPIRNVEGVITQYVATKEDITLMKQMERELKESKEQAEAANRSKSEFLANMSHEIRTPLNGIKGMIDLTLFTELTLEQQENLKIANTCAESLLNVINDILDFSKIEAGKMQIENLEFDIRSFLEKILKPHYIRANEKFLKMTFNIQQGIPKILIGDPNRLAQVLNNLIGNALKFTEEGSISIYVKKKEQIDHERVLLQFIVKDSGIGIEKEKKDLLFKSFSQIDGTITRKYGGTGLGLAISKKLVELMGGHVHVESEKDKGSIFYFTTLFGFKDKFEIETSEGLNGNEMTLESGKQRLKILLAEDNQMNQIVTASILKKRGHMVEIVNNGKETVEWIKKQKCDLILMDIQMPEVDGVEATKTIRNMEKGTGQHIPIIALTAYALQGDKEKFLQAGMDGYISKPIQIKELMTIIERAIQSDRGSTQEENRIKKGEGIVFGGSRSMLSEEEWKKFLELVPQYIEYLRDGINVERYEKIERYAHLIKTLCYELDLDHIKNHAFKIELAARKEKLEEIKVAFVKLLDSFNKIKKVISNK